MNPMATKEILLTEISKDNVQDCRDAVAFINLHYQSEIPTELSALTSGRLTCFWAKDGDRTIGITGYVAKTPFLAETAKTVLHSDHRGKGWGVILSQAIEDEVRSRGFKKVMTTIYVDNLPMIIIKLKQGYRFEGTHFDHEKPGLHEYSFGKILSE
jgi:GNAT superfamily N-acetyltransferase